jgi:hypothetical protein
MEVRITVQSGPLVYARRILHRRGIPTYNGGATKKSLKRSERGVAVAFVQITAGPEALLMSLLSLLLIQYS